MRARHTPGPWAVEWPEEDGSLAMIEGPIVRGAEGQLVAEVLSIGLDESPGHYDVHADADARLIAAAPEMLEALTDLEWSGTTDLPGGGTGACCPECEGIAPDVRLPIWAHDCYGHVADCRILAVIARATGEEAPHG
ncbi:MAG TPA: hypothetical protein VK039_07925 [Brevibacterium sp.]|nr:hypothetical protein [Brevibacterium sp.]